MTQVSFSLSVLAVVALAAAGIVVARAGLRRRLQMPVFLLFALFLAWHITEAVRFLVPTPPLLQPLWGFALLYVVPAVVMHLLFEITSGSKERRRRRRLLAVMYPAAAVVLVVSMVARTSGPGYGTEEPGEYVERARGALYLSQNEGLDWTEVWRSTGPEWPHSIVYADFGGTVYAAVGHLRQEHRPRQDHARVVRRSHGVLRSRDGGRTWRHLHIEHHGYRLTASALAASPHDPNLLLAGAAVLLGPEESGLFEEERVAGGPNPCGIYRSDSGGDSWTQVQAVGPGQLPEDVVTAITFCQNDPERAYAAGTRTVLRSDDAGVHWRLVGGGSESGWAPDGLGTAEPIALRCETNGSDGDHLVMVTRDRGIFESFDGGSSWRGVENRPSTACFHDVIVSGADGPVVACGASGLWHSSNEGESWILHRQEGRRYPPVYSALEADPERAGYLLCAPVPFQGFLVSRDSGRSWTDTELPRNPAATAAPHATQEASEPDEPLGAIEITDIAFAPADASIVYAAAAEELCKTEHEPQCGDGRVLRSRDGGMSWEYLQVPDAEKAACLDVAVSPRRAQLVYVAAGDCVYRSTDAGLTWDALLLAAPSESDEPAGERYRSVAVDPGNPERVLVGTDGDGILLSENGGATWRSVAIEGCDEAFCSSIEEIVFDRWRGEREGLEEREGRVYAIDYFAHGYLESRDGGATWRFVAVDDMRRAKAVTVEETTGTVYIATAGTGLFRIDETVQRVGPPVGVVSDAGFTGSTALVTDPIGGALKRSSTDGSWMSLEARIPRMLPDHDGPSAIAVRPDNTARAYAGYEGAGLVGEWELGIDGASRLLHVGPLPGSAEKEYVVVRDIAAAPGRSHEVLAATEEEVWRGPAGAAGFKLSRHIGAPLAWRALENLYLAAVAIGLAVVVFVLIRRAVREQKPDHEMAMLQAVGVGVFLLVMAVEGGPLTVFAVFPRWSVTVYAVLLSVILVYAVRRQSVYLVDPGRVAEGLIAGIEAPVVVADFAGRVIAANQGAHTSFRTYTDGLCGTALSELAGNVDGIDGTDLPLEQFARENRSVPSVCRSEEGSSFDCILSFSYLKNRAGQDIGYIISVTHSRGLKTPENRFGFTDREMEILRLLVQGMSYREIADRLFISLPTVKSHVHNIYEKSGARNRLHLSRLVE